ASRPRAEAGEKRPGSAAAGQPRSGSNSPAHTSAPGDARPRSPRASTRQHQAIQSRWVTAGFDYSSSISTRRDPDSPYRSPRPMTRLFRILQPQAHGGFEYGFDVFAELVATIGRGCGSSAWVYGLRPSPLRPCLAVDTRI